MSRPPVLGMETLHDRSSSLDVSSLVQTLYDGSVQEGSVHGHFYSFL